MSGETRPAKRAEKDVRSIDSIIAALYAGICGPGDQPRDWDRWRRLFVPGALLIPVEHGPNGEITINRFTVDEFIAWAVPQFAQLQGFYEREIARHTDTYSHIVQVFSTYESRHARNEKQPFRRGINSIQLLNDGHRWWIVTVFWHDESSDHPIPKEYLTGGSATAGP